MCRLFSETSISSVACGWGHHVASLRLKFFKHLVINGTAQIVGFVVFFLVVGLPFFGVGIQEMLDTHIMMLVRDGHYRGGSNNFINPDIFWNGIRGLYAQFTPFLTIVIGILTVIGLKSILKGDLKAFRFSEEIAVLLFLVLSVVLLSVGIAKHYVPYYSLSISAVFPFLTLYLLRRAGRLVALCVLAFVTITASEHAMNARDGRMAESQTGIASTMDEQVILEDPVPEGAVNVWFYRTQAATGYRMTLIQFSSLYSKQQKFLEINGPNIEGSPWNDTVYYEQKVQKLKQINFHKIVMDKRTRDYIENVKIHEWLFGPQINQVELNQLVYFERAEAS